MTTVVLFGIEKPRATPAKVLQVLAGVVTACNPPPQSNATARSTPARSTPLYL